MEIVPVTGMAALITAITSFVTAAVDWLTSYVGAITASGNEVLLLAVVAIPVAGFGVGILRRLINIRA